MTETQHSIAQWCLETFGPVLRNKARIIERADEEMGELVATASDQHSNFDIGREMADVVIVLYHAAAVYGIDLHKEIDAKMQINRAREWEKLGDGTGYHVKEKIAV